MPYLLDLMSCRIKKNNNNKEKKSGVQRLGDIAQCDGDMVSAKFQTDLIFLNMNDIVLLHFFEYSNCFTMYIPNIYPLRLLFTHRSVRLPHRVSTCHQEQFGCQSSRTLRRGEAEWCSYLPPSCCQTGISLPHVGD